MGYTDTQKPCPRSSSFLQVHFQCPAACKEHSGDQDSPGSVLLGSQSSGGRQTHSQTVANQNGQPKGSGSLEGISHSAGGSGRASWRRGASELKPEHKQEFSRGREAWGEGVQERLFQAGGTVYAKA